MRSMVLVPLRHTQQAVLAIVVHKLCNQVPWLTHKRRKSALQQHVEYVHGHLLTQRAHMHRPRWMALRGRGGHGV